MAALLTFALYFYSQRRAKREWPRHSLGHLSGDFVEFAPGGEYRRSALRTLGLLQFVVYPILSTRTNCYFTLNNVNNTIHAVSKKKVHNLYLCCTVTHLRVFAWFGILFHSYRHGERISRVTSGELYHINQTLSFYYFGSGDR